MSIKIKKYEYIDAIRGIAILFVILIHSSQWIPPTSYYFGLVASHGNLGVQLFFLISALTLSLSMSARKEKEKNPIINFFIRRFFRIAPAYYFAIFIYTLYFGMFGNYWAPDGTSWWYIFLNIFFLHGWHPETINSIVPGGWSIAVEMTFYLFIPYFFIKLKSIKITVFILFISLVVANYTSDMIIYFISSLYFVNHNYLLTSFTYFWFFAQLPVFILGILTYQIIKKYPNSNVSSLLLTLSLLLIVSLLLLLFPGYFNIPLCPFYFLYSVAFMLFILALHYLPYRFFVNKILMFFGKLSFSLYLVHFMVLHILQIIFSKGFLLDGDIGLILAFSLLFIISVVISYITYNFIEIPGINFGKKIIKMRL